ncbi:diguanylate cyclase domain-containing protein [Marinicellulosiphila megalodicopiae]|uniref:diguanylate cyclase domain-containing protein n=1 Tax=Marinicellulosiphila megalodicopiae TaxID=2724896 RepID=UPI003BB0A5DA
MTDSIKAEKKLNILLLEDDSIDAQLIKSYLNESNTIEFNITRVETIRDCLTKLDTQIYDLILTDLSVQDSSGVETVNHILTSYACPAVIVITQLDDDVMGEKVVHLGCEDYLYKGDLTSKSLIKSILYAIERHYLTEQIKIQAEQDPLTNLPNRSFLFKRLDQLLIENNHNNIAVAMIDLDGFKEVNDTYGHRAGDELLVQVAERLKRNIRKSDFVARFGGDEFIIVYHHFNNWGQIKECCARVAESLSEPIFVYSNKQLIEVKVGASIGVMKFTDTMSLNEIITGADKLMYISKSNGKNQVTYTQS